MRARRKIVTRVVRHPVTSKQFRLSARTLAELEVAHDQIVRLRGLYRLGRKTPADVDQEIRSLRGKRPVTLSAAADAYTAREVLAENTREGVRSLLRSHAERLAPLTLNELDAKIMRAWVDQLRARRVSVESILCYWRRLRSVVSFAIDRGVLAAFPWGDWRPKLTGRDPKRRESCRSWDELVPLLAAARELDVRTSFLLAAEAKIATAASFGLRQGELAGLRWSDVDWRECLVVVARQYEGRLTKTKHRPKPMRAYVETFEILADHRARLEDRGLYSPSGPIFPASHLSRPGAPRHYVKGECLTTRTLRAVVRIAGLPNEKGWSPHSLRDTFATLEALAHGGDLATTADRTRHRSVPQLARYLHAVRAAIPAPGFRLPPTGNRFRLPPGTGASD